MLGRLKNDRHIQLHVGFLPVILGGHQDQSDFSCGHRNLYRLAQASLIHEISHIYDKNAPMPPKKRVMVDDLEEDGCYNVIIDH